MQRLPDGLAGRYPGVRVLDMAVNMHQFCCVKKSVTVLKQLCNAEHLNRHLFDVMIEAYIQISDLTYIALPVVVRGPVWKLTADLNRIHIRCCRLFCCIAPHCCNHERPVTVPSRLSERSK